MKLASTYPTHHKFHNNHVKISSVEDNLYKYSDKMFLILSEGVKVQHANFSSTQNISFSCNNDFYFYQHNLLQTTCVEWTLEGITTSNVMHVK
jgi:hypothetical protein